MAMSIAFVMKSFWWNFSGSRQLGYDLRRVEPYVLAFCVDARGGVHRSVTPIYTNSPRQGRAQMTGTGHIFYGPGDPGGVLAFAIAVVESDEDIRRAGARIETFFDAPDVKATVKAASDLIVKAVATAGNAAPVTAIVTGVASLLEQSLKLVARAMKSNADDIMWVNSGSFLADTGTPYQWGRRFEVGSALEVDGKPAFGMEFEVLRTSDELRQCIDQECKDRVRRLPTIVP